MGRLSFRSFQWTELNCDIIVRKQEIMEFPDLGKKCSWPFCKTLDFLPFICSYCNCIFCKDHFNQDVHECQSFKKDVTNQTDIKSFVCSSEECTTCSPVEMLCQKCQKHFCLVHRYHDCFDIVDNIETKKQMWSKPEEQFDESVKNVNDVINKSLKKALQNPKKQITAQKIQLMRLKGKAKGASNIPLIERIYFLVFLPKSSIKSSEAVFISENWSVGKVIDSISAICNISNKNNELKAPKLRLFKSVNGNQISTDTSAKITALINNGKIINGETLILEYVNPNEDINSFELSNFKEYNDSV